MKKIAVFIFLSTFAFSCSNTNEKTNNENAAPGEQQEVKTDDKLPGADYNSLFTDFTCNMSVAEVAKVFGVPESDVSTPDYKKAEGCAFVIKGFGQNGLGDETIVSWFLEKTTKAEVKKEIQNYQELEKTNSGLGMSIEKSETGDTYLAKSPRYGRVIVLNENYDNWLLISYAPKFQYKTRTDEQHLALEAKSIALANYLLKKHEK
ncbi:MAG: hypothetical protein KDC85_00960 [Saprospiraceae bacterium]|nr:hypothetical protein [Saprospiraceae bacterium]MCB9326881.1 hypothetical protein [Lewinellaceae bacterium]